MHDVVVDFVAAVEALPAYRFVGSRPCLLSSSDAATLTSLLVKLGTDSDFAVLERWTLGREGVAEASFEARADHQGRCDTTPIGMP
jgi:hypothetical protein